MSDILDTNNNYVLTTEWHEEDIEILRKKVESLEKNLFKSQTQIKKLESQLQKSQELISQNGKNTNNTSISFFLPSEFKDQWEKLLKDLLLEAFENIWFHPQWLSHIIQENIEIVYKETFKNIKEIINKLLKILNIPINNVSFERYIPKFRNLFQDNFTLIFTLTDDIYDSIISKLKEKVSFYKDFDLKQELDRDIDNKVFKKLIEAEFKLCIYMILHEPILTLNIEKYEKRELNYFFYNKNEHINIEGFGKNDPCLIILNPPMLKNKFAYQGIKPAVYIITNPDEKINEICQKNQALIVSSKQNKSIKNNSFDVSPDSVEKILTANSNKDIIDIKEHEQIKDAPFENKNKNSSSNNIIQISKFMEKEEFHTLNPDKNMSPACKDIVIDENTIRIAIGKIANEDEKMPNYPYKIRHKDNSPSHIATFSNDAMSICSIIDIDNHDNESKVIDIKEHFTCYDQPLKKEELRTYRSSSHKIIDKYIMEQKMDKYIIDHKNSQVTLRKKSQNITNSERMKDEVNIYYQTTMNNEKSENLSGNSFNFKIKNDSKNILNTMVTPKNDRINHQRIKSSHTGSFSSNNYVLSEDNSSVNNIQSLIINKHTSLSKKNMIYESCDKKEIIDLYKIDEINNLKRMFSSGAGKLKIESYGNRKNANQLNYNIISSPKQMITNKIRAKNPNLEFKNKVTTKLSKVNFNGNLRVNVNETNIISSPLKNFNEKRNVKLDSISIKKEVGFTNLTRNNESKEKSKKTSNDLKLNNKQYLENFEKVKDISREYNYLAYNEALLKYDNKSNNNMIINNLNKKSSKKLQSKNLSSDIMKLARKSKTIFKD